VKTKKEDIRLRELFRNKLENAEVIPSPSVNAKLMRKLALRKLLNFNPARFNIYYLGGLIVAGITAVLLFSTGESKTEQLPGSKVTSEVIESITPENSIAVKTPTNIQISDIFEKSSSEPGKDTTLRNSKVKSVQEPLLNIKAKENSIVTQTDVNSSLQDRELFTRATPERNKLQAPLASTVTLFEASVTKGCAPLNVAFINKSTAIDSCKWSFGDGGSSNEVNPVWIFDIDGEYKVMLTVYGAGGSQTTHTEIITVHPKPQAQFEIVPENAVLPIDEIMFYNYSTNAIAYDWDFGDGTTSVLFEPRHRYSKSGNYDIRLIVTSDFGCYDSLTVMNAFSGSEYVIDFPNAFIPNNQGPTGGYFSTKSDEGAQVFHPVSSGVSDYQLKIFSKLGILIFESSDINIGWDGYFRGQLCEPGVYIWKVRGNFRNGEPFTKMGDVTLLKN